MINRDVEKGVAAGTAVAGVAFASLLFGLSALTPEKRIKVVKFIGLLFMAFIASIFFIASLGVFSEFSKIPVNEKGMAIFTMVILVLPIIGTIYSFKKFFKKK